MQEPSANRLPVSETLVRHRYAISILVHGLLFTLAYFVACGMLNNFWRFKFWFWPYFATLLPFNLAAKLAVFGMVGLYLGFWRYVGIRDAVAVFKATTWSSGAFIVFHFLANALHRRLYAGTDWIVAYQGDQPFDFPQTIFLLDWGATMVLVVGARAAVRLHYEESRLASSGGIVRCLVLGAGNTGEMLLREILRMPEEKYRVIGFLDDDPGKQSVRIHDVPVMGRIDEVREVAEKNNISELLIAMPSAGQKRLRQVVELCQGANLRFRTMPGMADLIDGRVTVSQIRDVDIRDVLGREQVELDTAAIARFLQSKRIVVTGAGGSIGSEICRQLVRFHPARIVLIEQAENSLFQIDRELADLAPDIDRACRVADVCDAERINRVFEQERPQVVFHAAAHKHVPLMESNIGEAIKNNVRGTMTVAEAAHRTGVERFVLISTDKAVNPTSIMGCTKRVAELGLQHLGRRSQTHFITVRFGNVLGSSGSVVPIFRDQIARGGPVTVTHPEMTRYFMTIPEATQLVLQAGAMGAGGEIFVLDMGEPVKILDLAREMITLSGFRPGEDIEIVFSGIRPGEKLYEELSVRGEDMSPTQHEKIYVWRQREQDDARIAADIAAMIESADSETTSELRARLRRLVPEFCMNGEAAAADHGRPTAPTSANGALVTTGPAGQVA